MDHLSNNILPTSTTWYLYLNWKLSEVIITSKQLQIISYILIISVKIKASLQLIKSETRAGASGDVDSWRWKLVL